MPYIDLLTGTRLLGQFALNPKQYFLTLSDLQDLGTNDVNAYNYYEGLIAVVNEDKKQYIWREENDVEENRLLTSDFTYPNGTIANGIDYSNRSFNFFPYKEDYVTFADIHGENGLINGGIVHRTGLTYYVWATGYMENSEPIFVPVNGDVTLTAAHPTLKRWNVFVINHKKPAQGTVTLTAGSSGSVDTLSVDGNNLLTAVIPFDTDLATTAIAVAANITDNLASPYYASVSGDTINIISRSGGIADNGLVVAATTTSITFTASNLAGGLDTPQEGVIEGIPAVNPDKPVVNVTNQVEVGEKLLLETETTPAEVTTVLIWDENAGDPTEWNVTTSPIGTNLADAVNPYNNSVSMQITSAFGGLRIDTPSNPQTYNAISGVITFGMRNSAEWDNNQARIRFGLYDSAGAVASATLQVNRNSIEGYGFDHTQTDVWQRVTIPLNAMNLASQQFDRVFISFEGTPTINIDFIEYQTGANDNNNGGGGTGVTNYIDLSDTIDTDYVGKNGYIPAVVSEAGLQLTDPATLVPTPDLQAVTDVGALTTNTMTIENNTTSYFQSRNVADSQGFYAGSNGNLGGYFVDSYYDITVNSTSVFFDITSGLGKGSFIQSHDTLGGRLGLADANSAFKGIIEPATLTAERTVYIPNASNTLAVSVNGNLADVTGNITLPVGVETQEESVQVLANSSILDFVGTGATATDGGGGKTTITIPQLIIEDTTSEVNASAQRLNFLPGNYGGIVSGGGDRTNVSLAWEPEWEQAQMAAGTPANFDTVLTSTQHIWRNANGARTLNLRDDVTMSASSDWQNSGASAIIDNPTGGDITIAVTGSAIVNGGTSSIIVPQDTFVKIYKSNGNNYVVTFMSKEYFGDVYVPYTGATANVDLGAFRIDAASFNELELFYNVANTYISVGTDALGSASNADQVGIGFRAGQNSSGGQTVYIGTYAGQENTQSSSTFIGSSSGRYNQGNASTGIGLSSLNSNTGTSAVGIGTDAGRNNSGDSGVFIGVNAGIHNIGNFNTIVGTPDVSNIFYDDSGSAQNVANAATDVDTAQNRVTITAHGFGSIGDFINLRYSTTGTQIGGLFNNNIYKFEIIDANTIEAYTSNLSSTGTDTHTFTPQFNYSNITLLGYNAIPTASNQVVLGDTNVTEVFNDQANFVGQRFNGMYVNTANNASINLSYFDHSGTNTSSFSTSLGDSALATSTGGSNTAIGRDVLENNGTGTQNISVGYQSAQNLVGSYTTSIGSGTLQNTENANYTIGVGYTAGQNGSGTSNIFIGQAAGFESYSNSGISIGASSGYKSHGSSTITIGTNAGYYNQGDDNTIIGSNAYLDFTDDTGNAKDVADATTDINTTTNVITITGHGFGVSGNINLKYTTTGTPIGGLTSGSIYPVTLLNGNSFEIVGGNNLSSNGTDTHTFTPMLNAYTNVTVLGNGAEPTASNQVMLGDTAVTEVSSVTANFVGATFNDLELFAQISQDADNIGIGVNALESNTGNDVIGIGTNSLQNNTGGSVVAVGYDAGQNNTGANSVGMGYQAIENNTGQNSIGVGYHSLQNNTGTQSAGIGYYSLKYNTGGNSVGFGKDTLLYNSGSNCVGVGLAALQYNSESNNTALGHNAFNTFNDDTGNAKNVADASTDVDTVLNRITITAHGFGATSSFVSLRYTTTGTAIGGLTNNLIYKFEIIDANTIEYILGFATTGSDTHTFTPQFKYTNSTAVGTNAEPTASNQVVLGNSSVTEVVMGNGEILNNIKRVKVSLTATNVNNIGTTPITAITNPGTGFVINVISAFASLTYGATAFDNNTLDLETSGAGGTLFTWSSFLDSTADNLKTADRTSASDDDLIANTAVVLTGTDSVATGDSTVDVYITYEIIEL